MLYRFLAWYFALPAGRRRAVIAACVPLQETLFLGPCRNALNAAARFSPALAIASLPLLLCAGALTACVIGLFVYDHVVGIGYRLESKVAGWVFLTGVFGWVLLPLHLLP